MSDLNNSLNTSITVVQGCLIVTLPNEMTDKDIESGSNRVLMKAKNSYIKGTIFDLSIVSVLDLYSFEALKKASKAISLMGIMVVWIGLRPGVVSALLDLDVDVGCVKTAMNLEQGLKMISSK
ncbi:MAG: STAS domain-containing protein [Vallitalea sp.]|jgi:rsbT antagonist protein RsbS|nr:STAS domain-containing protein [Vallitalea sp.]